MKIRIVNYNVDENFDKNLLTTLPKEIEVPNDCALNDGNDVFNVFDYVADKVGVPIYDYEILTTKENAKILWDKLSDITVDNTDCIEHDWYIFKAGTNKIEIWKWFEDYFHVSVANDLMQ